MTKSACLPSANAADGLIVAAEENPVNKATHAASRWTWWSLVRARGRERVMDVEKEMSFFSVLTFFLNLA